jgi:hypothetical protein
MHLLLMSCILEFIFRIYYLVIIFLFYWIIDEEKGFSDFLVVWLSLVFTGLIRIWFTFDGNRLLLPYDIL